MRERGTYAGENRVARGGVVVERIAHVSGAGASQATDSPLPGAANEVSVEVDAS
jgi:hypothetical protein